MQAFKHKMDYVFSWAISLLLLLFYCNFVIQLFGMQLAKVILFVHSVLLFVSLQLNGASPELVNKLIPEHVKRQMGLNFMHLAGT
jgi:hypothetical protein